MLKMEGKMTEETILKVGLSYAGFDPYCSSKWIKESQQDCFKNHYGSRTIVVLKLYNDLQSAAKAGKSACSTAGKTDLTTLLLALWFLKRYPTELEMQAKSNLSEASIRKRVWAHVKDIQALKSSKVSYITSIIDNFLVSSLTYLISFTD